MIHWQMWEHDILVYAKQHSIGLAILQCVTMNFIAFTIALYGCSCINQMYHVLVVIDNCLCAGWKWGSIFEQIQSVILSFSNRRQQRHGEIICGREWACKYALIIVVPVFSRRPCRHTRTPPQSRNRMEIGAEFKGVWMPCRTANTNISESN